MKLKSLLFGSAAILAVGTGAQAADLPMAEPVDYVRICDAFGTGFYYIPGTDTCLKVGGRVRVEAAYVFGDDEEDAEGFFGVDTDDEDFNNFTTRSRGYLYLDARTQTDIGLVRAYISMHMTVGHGGAFSSSDPDENYDGAGNDLEQAFIQISNDMGTFTAGHTASFFDFFGSNGFGSRIGIDDNTTEATLFAYTFGAGNGISATLSLEDPASAGRRLDGEGVYTGQEYPDVVANVRIDQGWGAAQIMGVIHDVHNDEDEFDDHEMGWAVGAGLSLTVPGIGAAFNMQAGYAEGALGYITTDPGGIGDIDDDGELNTAWNVRAGLNADFTDTIGASIDASYTSVEEADVDEYDFWGVMGTLYYTPVSGLLIGAEVAYNNIDADGDDAGDEFDDDVWGVMLRVQRTF
jgi:hypothetical protein